MTNYSDKGIMSEIKTVLEFITFISTAIATINTLLANLDEFVVRGNSVIATIKTLLANLNELVVQGNLFITIFSPLFYAVGRAEIFVLIIFLCCLSPIAIFGIFSEILEVAYSTDDIWKNPVKIYLIGSGFVSLILGALLILNEDIAFQLVSNIFSFLGLQKVSDAIVFNSNFLIFLGGMTFLYCGYLAYQAYRNYSYSNSMYVQSVYTRSKR